MAVISKTAILTPAAVDLTISKFKGESSPFTNAIGKGSDNTGNYAEWGLVTGRQAYTKVYWSFDMSSIPSNATITNVDKAIDFDCYTLNLVKHRPPKK